MRKDVRRQYPVKTGENTPLPASTIPPPKKEKRSMWSFLRRLGGPRSPSRDGPNAVITITNGETAESSGSDRGTSLSLEAFLCRTGCVDLMRVFHRHNITRVSDLRVLPVDTYTVLVNDDVKRERLLRAIGHFYPTCRSAVQRKASGVLAPIVENFERRSSSTLSMSAGYEDVSSSVQSSGASEAHDRTTLIDVLTQLGAVRHLPCLLSNGLCTPQAILNCSDTRLAGIIPQEALREQIVMALMS